MRGLQSNFDLKNALKKIQIAKIKIKKREKIQKKIENKKKHRKTKLQRKKKINIIMIRGKPFDMNAFIRYRSIYTYSLEMELNENSRTLQIIITYAGYFHRLNYHVRLTLLFFQIIFKKTHTIPLLPQLKTTAQVLAQA